MESSLSKARTSALLGPARIDRPRAIVLMGLPGTGKSYLGRHLHAVHGFTVLSGENVTAALFGTGRCTGAQYREAYSVLRLVAKEFLREGRSLVIDGTNLQRAFRDEYRTELSPFADVRFLHLVIDDATAFARANARGIDARNPKNVLSDVSRETFDSFKGSFDSIDGEDDVVTLVSDEHLLKMIDTYVAESP